MNGPMDCRSEAGVTIGLIDAIISIARIVAKRDFKNPEVQEALKDLIGDEDIKLLLAAGLEARSAAFVEELVKRGLPVPPEAHGEQ